MELIKITKKMAELDTLDIEKGDEGYGWYVTEMLGGSRPSLNGREARWFSKKKQAIRESGIKLSSKPSPKPDQNSLLRATIEEVVKELT